MSGFQGPLYWLHIGFSTAQYDEYIHDMYFRVVYMVGVSFILIVFVGYFFARWISRPVSIISQLATQVAGGDLTVRSTIKLSDEIGVLSDSFNQMVDSLSLSKQQLQNYNQELESQVLHRTHELADLNRDLDKRIKDEVAQRQKQEALLIHQSRLAAMGEMIGAIAHQWRQPLNALGLVQQNLQFRYQMGKLDDEFMNQNMEKSERLIQKMSSTIDDFRNFFKPNKIEAKCQPNGNVIIVIKDNGGGIPDAIVDKIYDPYFTTKEEGKGTGIGLYMSKIIVGNNMSGTLRAFNDADGANFVIEIKSNYKN